MLKGRARARERGFSFWLFSPFGSSCRVWSASHAPHGLPAPYFREYISRHNMPRWNFRVLLPPYATRGAFSGRKKIFSLLFPFFFPVLRLWTIGTKETFFSLRSFPQSRGRRSDSLPSQTLRSAMLNSFATDRAA